jgi:hypothetical protein
MNQKNRTASIPALVTVFAVLAVALSCAGSRSSLGGDAPITHRQAAERAIFSALESMKVPGGASATVSLRIEDRGRACDPMLRLAAEDYLVRNGYRVRAGEEVPCFTFRADTLSVTLERSGGIRNASAARSAETAVTAVFRPDASSWLGFGGHGSFRGTIPLWAVSSMGRDLEFVNDQSRLFGAVRPVFLGLLVTGFVWLLYSYRG